MVILVKFSGHPRVRIANARSSLKFWVSNIGGTLTSQGLLLTFHAMSMLMNYDCFNETMHEITKFFINFDNFLSNHEISNLINCLNHEMSNIKNYVSFNETMKYKVCGLRLF